MKHYEQELQQKEFATQYFDHRDVPRSLDEQLRSLGESTPDSKRSLVTVEPVDFILKKRLKQIAAELNFRLEFLPNPGFINSPDENASYRQGRKRWFMADFYKWQRRRLGILMEDDQPVGGHWSFDKENRKKVPKRLLGQIPKIPCNDIDQLDEEARAYVETNYDEHPGSLEKLIYPTTRDTALAWLRAFLEMRLDQFGAYEDAMVAGESWLWHSVLTPSLKHRLAHTQRDPRRHP